MTDGGGCPDELEHRCAPCDGLGPCERVRTAAEVRALVRQLREASREVEQVYAKRTGALPVPVAADFTSGRVEFRVDALALDEWYAVTVEKGPHGAKLTAVPLNPELRAVVIPGYTPPEVP